ncbi:FtsK/SpoIIIE domain-containing protein [Arthrobacter castelli]|uniref:FtsK/SpoIIIE domain-containing protein n=1 Tax=Arthrobacter castelli TaxID=271431 RepID=UPI000409C10D|nr:FtsK/SpoIIIE domain-containing protein [Arthrobacter castelli]
MRLHVTVAAAPGLALPAVAGHPGDGLLSGLNRGPAELVLELDSASGRLVEERLGHEIPCPARFWVDGSRLSDLNAGHPPLVSGAVILAGPVHGPAPARPDGSPDALIFSVLSGPDTGRVHVLKRGRYTIGRTTADIPIADPQLSRRHAELIVEPTSILIADQGSSNGTTIDGSKTESDLITTASRIRIGTSMCALRFASGFPDLDAAPIDPSEPLTVHRELASQRRGIMLITAILPVTIGVALALITGMWMFLAFSAMSALTMLIPVLGGRKHRKKFQRELATANRDDAARRKATTPSVAETIRHTVHHAGGTCSAAESHGRQPPDDCGPLSGWIRLGAADQAANVRLDPPDRDFTPTLLHDLPVALDLARRTHLDVTGNGKQITGLLRSLVIQVSSWTDGSRRRLIFYGVGEQMPAAVRFLPQAELIQTLNGLIGSLQTATDQCIVLFMPAKAPVTENLQLQLQELATARRLITIRYAEQPPQADVPTVTLLRDGAVLKNAGPVLEFVPDLVNAAAFERYCRNRARLDMAAGPGYGGGKAQALPGLKALDKLVDPAPERILERWAQDHDIRLGAPVGVSSSCDMWIDLDRDGPHLLVAGTTGSGKSELLRTMIMSLCLNHSPLLMNFLLVDFKGGSGLSPLRKLPHSVGLLTDLSAESMERAMESLRAEIRRRESLFASVEAADIAAYQRLRGHDMEEVPRLIVVIDEFRMLLEEIPSAMDELLRIAAVGRSLGLHLVMATQRPQGAVSADIRANITTSISLRVQTPMESQDILGTSDAADISVTLPGRAYLKRSGEPVREFQSASSSLMRATSSPVGVQRLESFLLQDAASQVRQNAHGEEESSLARYVDAACQAWRTVDGTQPRQPVLPDLPDRIGASAVADLLRPADVGSPKADGARPEVTLGLLDIPARQEQLALQWSPRRDSHLAVVGGPRSGANDTLRHVTGQLLTGDLKSVHLYVLDGDGSLPGLGENPQVGAYVTGHDLRRAARVVQRLGQSVAERLTAGQRPVAGSAAAHVAADHSTAGALPDLVLVIAGWGRWLSALRSSPWAQAEDTLQDVVRDGRTASVTVLINGDRELVTSRMFSSIENRLFLPTGASAETLMAWPRLPPMKKVPGRAYVQGSIAPHPGIAQLMPCGRGGWPPPHGSRTGGEPTSDDPFRVDALPRVLRAADLPAHETGPDESVVGVKGDHLQPAVIRVPPLSVYLVLGGPKSGKTSALKMLAIQGPKQRRWILARMSFDDHSEAPSLISAHNQSPIRQSAPAVPTMILVDDVDHLSPQAQHQLTQFHNSGYGVIMSASNNPALMSRIPLGAEARAAGRGMILMPQSPFDADFFGLRIEPDPTSVPGRAAIIDGQHYEQAQLLQLPDSPG